MEMLSIWKLLRFTHAIDLQNRLNSVIIFHMNIISWDVVHVKLWLKMYLDHDFGGIFDFPAIEQTFDIHDTLGS